MEELINKRAAIDALLEEVRLVDGYYVENDEVINKDDAIEAIRLLPSAQPETAKRIVGKSRDGMTLWYQCNICNEPVDAQDNFCRGCGRRLTDE